MKATELKTATATVKLAPTLKQDAREKAAKEGKTLSAKIEELVSKYVKDKR